MSTPLRVYRSADYLFFLFFRFFARARVDHDVCSTAILFAQSDRIGALHTDGQNLHASLATSKLLHGSAFKVAVKLPHKMHNLFSAVAQRFSDRIRHRRIHGQLPTKRAANLLIGHLHVPRFRIIFGVFFRHRRRFTFRSPHHHLPKSLTVLLIRLPFGTCKQSLLRIAHDLEGSDLDFGAGTRESLEDRERNLDLVHDATRRDHLHPVRFSGDQSPAKPGDHANAPGKMATLIKA